MGDAHLEDRGMGGARGYFVEPLPVAAVSLDAVLEGVLEESLEPESLDPESLEPESFDPESFDPSFDPDSDEDLPLSPPPDLRA